MPKVDAPGENSAERAQLSQDEQDDLDRAIRRAFEDTRSLDTQTVVQKLTDYRNEIVQAAEIAKAEFDSQFDGHSPQSGNFGLDWIHSGYFGYDSWDNIPDLTAGSTQIWIDDSVPDNVSGSGGQSNPLTVGDPAVHIILGVGSYSQTPKFSRVRWRLNDQPRPSVSTDFAYRNTDLRLQWLDTPLVLAPDDDVFAEVYADMAGSASPYLMGLSFIEAKAYRELDPADMAGTDNSNIAVE